MKLIRKAKNQEAEKATGHNSVVANDDFISFGSDHEDDEDDEDDARNAIQGSLNDFTRNGSDLTRNMQEAARADYGAPRGAKTNNKRKAIAGGIVDEWLPTRNGDATPWLPSRNAYVHLARDPEKW